MDLRMILSERGSFADKGTVEIGRLKLLEVLSINYTGRSASGDGTAAKSKVPGFKSKPTLERAGIHKGLPELPYVNLSDNRYNSSPQDQRRIDYIE